MNNELKKTEISLSDYLYILFKWKKILIILMIIVIAITTLITFLVPNQYKSTSVVMIPPETSISLSALTGLVGGKSTASSLGAKLLGSSKGNEDIIMGILSSRTVLMAVINKFNLMSYYDIDDNNMDKALKKIVEDISCELNEYGMIEISVINKDSVLSAEMNNFMLGLVDSLNIAFNIQNAKSNREFIEKRYLKNVYDLKMAEDSFYRFQKKYGIFAVPEQFEAAIKASAELEALLISKEVLASTAKIQFGENSPNYLNIIQEINLLKNKISELKKGEKLSFDSNVFLPFKNAPEISIEYIRLFRELEIQTKIMEIVLPLYEQAKVEENKTIPTISILDKAKVPELKYSPKRAIIIVGIAFLFLVILVLFVLRGEKAVNRIEFKNPLLKKETDFYLKTLKLFRAKES